MPCPLGSIRLACRFSPHRKVPPSAALRTVASRHLISHPLAALLSASARRHSMLPGTPQLEIRPWASTAGQNHLLPPAYPTQLEAAAEELSKPPHVSGTPHKMRRVPR